MPRIRAARVIPFVVLACFSLIAVGVSATRTRADDNAPGPDLTGSYPITGTFPDGGEYSGTVEIKKLKHVSLRKGPSYDLWALKFHYSTDWDGVGVGLWIDNRLCFVLAHEGKAAMVSVYRPLKLSEDLQELQRQYAEAWRKRGKHEYVSLKGDPWYGDIWDGQFYSIFACLNGDWGAADLWGDKGSEPLGEGKFGGSQCFYSDKGKNLSRLSGAGFKFSAEKQDGDAYKILLHPTHDGGTVDKGDPWEGIALMPDAQTLLVVTGGNDSQGVGYYEIVGKTLVGHIADQGNASSYPQVATVPDGVLARNSSLFH